MANHPGAAFFQDLLLPAAAAFAYTGRILIDNVTPAA